MKRPKPKKILKALKAKKKEKHFSRNFKGKVIDGVHELYALTAGMIHGMRFSVCESDILI
jgi:hypothetical protein